MIKSLIIVLFVAGTYFQANGQNMGVSFSFFFPQGGSFSIPVSPFSYRGVSLPFNDYVGVQTGFSLYRMGGQKISGLPFESKKPMYGPNLTTYVPLELYLQFGNKKASITTKAGVYGIYGFLTNLNYGNIDRAIKLHEQWDVANADFTYKTLPGWGYQGGVEFLYYVNRKWGITMEVNYLYGGAKIDIDGSYTGGVSGNIQTVQLDPALYHGAKVEFTGLEISLGAVF